MSVYSTRCITRKEAEELVMACRFKNDRSARVLSDDELSSELHTYVYSDKYMDILGCFTNFMIVPEESV